MPRNPTNLSHIDISVPPELLGRLDDWRNRQPIPASRRGAMIHILQEFLDREIPVRRGRGRPRKASAWRPESRT